MQQANLKHKITIKRMYHLILTGDVNWDYWHAYSHESRSLFANSLIILFKSNRIIKSISNIRMSSVPIDTPLLMFITMWNLLPSWSSTMFTDKSGLQPISMYEWNKAVNAHGSSNSSRSFPTFALSGASSRFGPINSSMWADGGTAAHKVF